MRYTRPLAAILAAAALSSGLSACGGSDAAARDATATTGATASGPRTAYPVTVRNCGRPVTVTARPSRILGDQEQDAVPLFSAGAGDRVVAIFSHTGGDLDFDGIAKPVADAIRALPGLSPKDTAYPSFEKVLAERPDLIVQAYPGDATGGNKKNEAPLRRAGIPVYTETANCDPTATLDANFADLRKLGVLLDTQATANAAIAAQRAQLARIEAAVKGRARPKAFLLDSFPDKGGAVYTNTGGYARDLISRAGADPVPASGPDVYSTSREAIAAAGVDVLLVTHYGDPNVTKTAGTDAQRAARWFAAFPTAPASTSRRWIAVPYPSGPNAVLIIERTARGLHPDAFSDATTTAP